MIALRRSALGVFALVVAVTFGWPSSAQAQFGPTARFTYSFGISPRVSYNPYLPFLPQVPGRFSLHTYTLSGVGGAGPYSLSYVYYRNAAVRSYGPLPNYAEAGFPSLYSSYGGSNSRVAEAQRMAIAKAQQNAQWNNAPAAAPDFDRWLKEGANRREGGNGKGDAVIDPTLISPSQEAVLSGDVLNDLAGRIRELEAEGRKANAGLLPPALTEKVVFAGGPAAEAANVYRQPDLRFPTALNGAPHLQLRAELIKAYTPVVNNAKTGKKINPADVDWMLKSIEKAREAARPVIAEAPLEDASEVSEFFTHLQAATKYLQDPESTGVAGDSWGVVGATVSEVVGHMKKFDLRFGPCKAGEEPAYYSLHRGLLNYYASLLKAK